MNNFSEILRLLDSLQLSAKYPIATPVDWKVNWFQLFWSNKWEKTKLIDVFSFFHLRLEIKWWFLPVSKMKMWKNTFLKVFKSKVIYHRENRTFVWHKSKWKRPFISFFIHRKKLKETEIRLRIICFSESSCLCTSTFNTNKDCPNETRLIEFVENERI